MNLRAYYTLAKPGIIYGNLFTAVGAFFLGSHWHPNLIAGLCMTLGLGAIIGSASVFNNYFDRDIDSKMERTKNRPSVTGAVSGTAMLLYGSILALIGSALLFFFVNTGATLAALFGWFSYVVLYTLLSKRGSEWGTFIGGSSGAMPPAVGYIATTGNVDVVAITLFLMLVFWQMPHAYGIALYRLKDYEAAAIPVLPIARSIRRTKIETLIYILLFIVTTLYLTKIGATNTAFALIATAITIYWLFVTYTEWSNPDVTRFGKRVFLTSLIVLVVVFVAMGICTTII
jgi:protoheme IX farnesyltransferase